MRCIVCKSKNMEKFMNLPDSPLFPQHLLKKEEPREGRKTDLQLEKCKDCNLVQLKPRHFVMDGYYEDYLLMSAHTEYARNYMESLAQNFVKRFELYGKKILEVGCGDGYFAGELIKLGVKVLGVEPSKRAASEARSRKIDVCKCPLDDKSPIEREAYDGFVLRQVLEHISDPCKFLGDIRLYLKEGACGLVEVPDFDNIIHKRRYFDIFQDHAAYFTFDTLRKTLEMCGFRIHDMFSAADGEYIAAYIVNTTTASEETGFKEGYGLYVKSVQAFLKKLKEEGGRMAAWGAGYKGVSLLSCCGIDERLLDCIVDSDSNKQGLYAPGSGLFICSPSYITTGEIDVVVVTSIMYEKEIIRILNRDMGYKGKICVLIPTPKILNNDEIFEFSSGK